MPTGASDQERKVREAVHSSKTESEAIRQRVQDHRPGTTHRASLNNLCVYAQGRTHTLQNYTKCRVHTRYAYTYVQNYTTNAMPSFTSV
eukprot:3985364-Amphidinium_carterae.1